MTSGSAARIACLSIVAAAPNRPRTNSTFSRDIVAGSLVVRAVQVGEAGVGPANFAAVDPRTSGVHQPAHAGRIRLATARRGWCLLSHPLAARRAHGDRL